MSAEVTRLSVGPTAGGRDNVLTIIVELLPDGFESAPDLVELDAPSDTTSFRRTAINDLARRRRKRTRRRSRPSTIPGPYGLSWIKLTVDGDARYRPFLDKAASGLSDFATTLH